MMTKTVLKVAVIVAVVIVVVLGIAAAGVMGNGSPRYARKWARRFEAIDSINVATSKYPVMHRQYTDGSWIFGVCSGSHCNPWGGTVVLRDSSGAARSFFGHVCSGAQIEHTLVAEQGSSNVQQFYEALMETGFEEYNWKEDKIQPTDPPYEK